MLFQRFLKRIKKRIDRIDFFYLAFSPGLEPTFLYDFLKGEDYNFKPVVVSFDDRSRSVRLKDIIKIDVELSPEEIFRVLPKRKYFSYYSIIRGHLERFGINEGKFVLIPESSEEVFVHILYHLLGGNVQKIYKHKDFLEDFFVMNPIFDISRNIILKYVREKGLNFLRNPYKDEYYKSLSKIYEILSKYYEEFPIRNVIERNLRVINLKKLKCEKCGRLSLSKICDMCKIFFEVKREISREEKGKKPKKKLRPIRRVFRGVRR